MPAIEPTIHEVDFCAQIASAANQLFAEDPAEFPFAEARVEGFGTGAAKRKRKRGRSCLPPILRRGNTRSSSG